MNLFHVIQTKKSSVFLSSLVTLTSIAHSTQYQYHPTSRLYLAGGYNPYEPDRGYLKCIEHDGIDEIQKNGSVSSQYELSVLSSQKNFMSKLGFSTLIESSSWFLNGKMHFANLTQSTINENSITWMFFVKKNFGRVVLKNPRIKPKFVDLTNTDLLNSCGSEIVTEETHSSLMSVLFTVHSISREKIRTLSSQLNARISAKLWSTDVNSSLQKIIKSIVLQQQVSIKIITIGADGIFEQKLLSKDNLNFEKIYHLINESSKLMTKKFSSSWSFTTTPINAFLPQVEFSKKTIKQKIIQQLFSKNQYYLYNINKISEILNDYNLNLTAEQIQNLHEILKKCELFNQEVNQIALTCFDPKKESLCKSPPLKFINLSSIKQITQNKTCESLRQLALNKHMIGQDFYLMAKRRNFIPNLVNENNRTYIDSWYKCEYF
jgi:hypothetical protein